MSVAIPTPVEGLLNPAIYPHPCAAVQLVETHISWVFLTGLRAYKIKKPVLLDFVDFSTLQKRRDACFEELRLNRRLAPDLYLDVVPITGSLTHPIIDGAGTPIEYAVRMVQFDSQCLLNRLPAGTLQARHITDLADRCADFHGRAATAGRRTPFGSTEAVQSAVRANFELLHQTAEGLTDRLRPLRDAARTQLERLQPCIEDRKAAGRVRECHGDLHLGNMFLQGDRVTVFDGIEFNDDLRWIDVVSDIAFLIMDLEDRGQHALGNRFLNRWLERTGDYAGLAVLRLYCAYRAMVRAKVDALRMQQQPTSSGDRSHLSRDCQEYLHMAEQYSQPLTVSLTITHGFSGSGKTTTSQRLIDTGNTIRIRSDVERKRLFGLAAEESSSPQLRQQMYAASSSREVYERLTDLATVVIEAGFPVVVDAAFLRKSDRLHFHRLANRLNVPFSILDCTASPRQLRQRLKARRADASEADLQVLSAQLQDHDPLDADERTRVIDTDDRVVSVGEC